MLSLLSNIYGVDIGRMVLVPRGVLRKYAYPLVLLFRVSDSTWMYPYIPHVYTPTFDLTASLESCDYSIPFS